MQRPDWGGRARERERGAGVPESARLPTSCASEIELFDQRGRDPRDLLAIGSARDTDARAIKNLFAPSD